MARTRGCPNPGHECECGNWKWWYGQACTRCQEIDGHPNTVAEIILLMRVHDTVTVDQLMLETGRSAAGLHNTLSRLSRAGRIRNLTPTGQYTLPAEYILIQ